MKIKLLAFALFLAALSFTPLAAQHVSVNINIGRQPAWGPVGYDYVSFYYLPDINCYYDIDLQLFYYPHRGQWASAQYLPYSYRDYDLYRMYKVVVNDSRPWMYNSNHIRSYARYKGYRSQSVIRYSTDRRYSNSRHNDIRWYDNSSNSGNSGRNDRLNNSSYSDRNDRRDNNVDRSSNSSSSNRSSSNRSEERTTAKVTANERRDNNNNRSSSPSSNRSSSSRSAGESNRSSSRR